MNRLLTILFCCLLFSAPLHAEEQATLTCLPATGDADFDLTLGELNLNTGGSNLEEFIDNLSVSWNVPRTDFVPLLQIPEIQPADIYMIGSLAIMLGQPMMQVGQYYQQNRGNGWGRIAQDLGIKPGSEEFHRLKAGGYQELDQARYRAAVKMQGKGKGKPAAAGGNKWNGQGHGNQGKDKSKGSQGKGKGKEK